MDPRTPSGMGTALQPGTRVGEYTLAERIGRGGFGDVWKAVHAELPGKAVALKFAADAGALGHLRTAARLQHALDHPAIVKTLGLNTQDDPGYLVMDYVPGESLRELLNREKTLPPKRALAIAGTLLEALDHAHRRGIVHADIKPENILVAADDRVCVTDFGLSRAIEDTGSGIQLSGPQRSTRAAIAGTLAYLSPEQRLGSPADPRSDLYAAGLVLHEMLAGHVWQLRFPLEGVSPRLSEVVERATRPDADARFQTATDMTAALSGAGREIRPAKKKPQDPFGGKQLLAPEDVLAEAIREALANGGIRASERSELQRLRQRLDISFGTATRIYREILAGQRGAAPIPEAPAPTPILAGQVLDFGCYNARTRFRGIVTGVEEHARIPARGRRLSEAAKGKFVVVFMRVENIGKQSGAVDRTSLTLKDSEDRLYDLVAVDKADWAAREHFGLSGPFTAIQPGLTELQVFLFDVAPGAKGYYLQGGGR